MMAFLQSAVAIVVAFGVLIVVHELGHLLVARWCGVKVLRFSIGMGKVVWARRFGKDRTEWAISLLPLGGYVKMLDAREQELDDLPAADLAREFTRQSVWRRFAIVAAGPAANFLLAVALFFGLYLHGVPEPVPRLRAVAEQTAAYQAGLRGGELITAVDGQPTRTWSDVRWQVLQLAVGKGTAQLKIARPGSPESALASLSLAALTTKDLEGDFMAQLGLELARPKAVIGKVAPGGPAMQAGLLAGDLIAAVDGQVVVDQLALRNLVRASPGKTLELTVRRNGKDLSLKVTPRAAMEEGKSIGLIEVELPAAPEMTLADETPVHALGKAGQRTWETAVLQLKMIGKMITGEVSWKNISGPITIADYAGQSARIGVVSYVGFIAFISIILGVMNLLPIPVLDGGLLLYYSLEVLTGRPISERFNEIAQRAGLAILMTLMIVAVFNDIARHLS